MWTDNETAQDFLNFGGIAKEGLQNPGGHGPM